MAELRLVATCLAVWLSVAAASASAAATEVPCAEGCPPDFTCVEMFGICTDRKDGSLCDTGRDCGSGKCVKRQCAGDGSNAGRSRCASLEDHCEWGVCDVRLGHCTMGQHDEFCTTSRDCEDPLVCYLNACTMENGELVRACAQDADCPSRLCFDGACEGGLHTSPCDEDHHCATGHVCSASHCVPAGGAGTAPSNDDGDGDGGDAGVKDPCGAKPCQNFGACEQSGTEERGYACRCETGFHGDHCEVRANACHDAPCANGGVCAENKLAISGYTCDCSGTPFVGDRCDLPAPEEKPPLRDSCSDSQCVNKGVCILDDGDRRGYRCACTTDFKGNNCETAVLPPHLLDGSGQANPCESLSPCQNGGICSPSRIFHGYECNCRSTGFKGFDCDVPEGGAVVVTDDAGTDPKGGDGAATSVGGSEEAGGAGGRNGDADDDGNSSPTAAIVGVFVGVAVLVVGAIWYRTRQKRLNMGAGTAVETRSFDSAGNLLAGRSANSHRRLVESSEGLDECGLTDEADNPFGP